MDTDLELDHANPLFDADLAHVQNPVVVHAHERQAVRSLFGALADDKHARIVLLCPELEGGCVFKRPDSVLFGEGYRVWSFEGHLGYSK